MLHKTLTILLVLISLHACKQAATDSSSAAPETATDSTEAKTAASDSRIPILNFATFHMGETSDKHSTEFDEKDQKNIADAKKISQLIAKFKPIEFNVN